MVYPNTYRTADLKCPGLADALTPNDLDISCAVAANLEMSWASKGTEAWSNAATLAVFYLGRLSSRDEQTHWATEIKRLVDGDMISHIPTR